MKATPILTFILIHVMVIKVNSQSFINGSFEKNSGGCNYAIGDSVFTNYVFNCYEFGYANQVDLMHDSCGFGTAQQGVYFIGLSVSGGGDAISMALDTPLTIGQLYNLTFYKKLDPSYVGYNMLVGYSNDSLSLGTIIDTVAAPVSNTWVQVSSFFTPAYSAKYVTVQIFNGFFGWNLVDNFALQAVTGLTHQGYSGTVHVFPNPFQHKTYLQFNSIDPAQVKIKLYDALGVEKHPMISYTNSLIEIDRKGLPDGYYVIKVLKDNLVVKQFKVFAD